MDKTRATVPQLLSAVAVVLSLLFVGFEIRQNTAAQRAESRQGLADASREFTLTIATDAEARRVWYGMFSPELFEGREAPQFTFSDSIHARTLMFTNMRNVENVFLQSLEGVIDESVLNTYNFTSATYHAPFFATLWGRIPLCQRT